MNYFFFNELFQTTMIQLFVWLQYIAFRCRFRVYAEKYHLLNSQIKPNLDCNYTFSFDLTQNVNDTRFWITMRVITLLAWEVVCDVTVPRRLLPLLALVTTLPRPRKIYNYLYGRLNPLIIRNQDNLASFWCTHHRLRVLAF